MSVFTCSGSFCAYVSIDLSFVKLKLSGNCKYLAAVTFRASMFEFEGVWWIQSCPSSCLMAPWIKTRFSTHLLGIKLGKQGGLWMDG